MSGRGGKKTAIDLRTSEGCRGLLVELEAVCRGSVENVDLSVEHPEVSDETFERFRKLVANFQRLPVFVRYPSANRIGALMISHLFLDEGKTRDETEGAAEEVGSRATRQEATLASIGPMKILDLLLAAPITLSLSLTPRQPRLALHAPEDRGAQD